MRHHAASSCVLVILMGCGGGASSGTPDVAPLPDVGVGATLDAASDVAIDGANEAFISDVSGDVATTSDTPTSSDGAEAATEIGVSVDALPVRDCKTSFSYALGSTATVAVFGEWDNFTTQTPMLDGLGSGTYRAELAIPVGEWGYKFIVNGTTYNFDPANATTRYVGGIENSRLTVGDCHQPLITVTSATATPDGTIDVAMQVVSGVETDGITAKPLDPTTVAITMGGSAVAASAITLDASAGTIGLHLTGLAPTKYTFDVNVSDTAAVAAADMLIPMWVEAEPFEWSDGPLYFVFTDRFNDGDTTNDGPVAGVDTRANYQGGDYAGLLSKLQAGYFDALGVRTIWISPVNENTHGAFSGSEDEMYSGYHGYWVTKPRDVESHWGSLDDLKAVTHEAHQHGIRVIFDIAQNQLHQEHDYYVAHATDGWFNPDNCICGTSACEWSDLVAIKTCWFTTYLPDVNWQNMDMVHAMIGDAMWWLQAADGDGFRVDAVKHMEDIATTSLSAAIHARFESGNARYYTVGETAGGNDDTDRQTIAHYIGYDWLAGQLDFPLYYAVTTAFAQKGGQMSDLDAEVQAGRAAYGPNAYMAPFLGSQDEPRFVSIANGDIASDSSAQAWSAPPAAPTTEAPYDQLFLAQVFLLTQPGLPLMYYGDEFGMPGTSDPDNRRFMRFGSDLSAFEQALLAKVTVVAKARGTLPGLRRGAALTLYTDGDGYVYTRGGGTDVVVIALNRGSTSRSVPVTIPASLGVADGTVLTDLLGGASVTVTGGAISVPFTPSGASIWTQ